MSAGTTQGKPFTGWLGQDVICTALPDGRQVEGEVTDAGDDWMTVQRDDGQSETLFRQGLIGIRPRTPVGPLVLFVVGDDELYDD